MRLDVYKDVLSRELFDCDQYGFEITDDNGDIVHNEYGLPSWTMAEEQGELMLAYLQKH